VRSLTAPSGALRPPSGMLRMSAPSPSSRASTSTLRPTWCSWRRGSSSRLFGGDVAETFWDRLRDSGVRIEPIVRADVEAAAETQASSPEEGFSFVNRTSFAMMDRIGITRAATFNAGFAAYRPRRGRKRPFQIHSEGHSEVYMALRQALLERRSVHAGRDGKCQTVFLHPRTRRRGGARIRHPCGREFVHEASGPSQGDLPSAVEIEQGRLADETIRDRCKDVSIRCTWKRSDYNRKGNEDSSRILEEPDFWAKVVGQ
jgi:hypothetical protein